MFTFRYSEAEFPKNYFTEEEKPSSEENYEERYILCKEYLEEEIQPKE